MSPLSQHKAFILLLSLVSIAFVWLLLPFYGAILWAVILAILFQPMHRRLESRLHGRRNTAAFISVMACVFIVIIPMSLIFMGMVREGASVYQRINNGEIDFSGYIQSLRDSLPPTVQDWMGTAGIGSFSDLSNRLASALEQGSQIIATHMLSIGQNTLQFLVSTGIMLYLLFFLFRDGRSLGRRIREAAPLSDAYTYKLTDKFTAVVRATVKGNVIIAVVQGAIGGVAFWALGIEGALLWGVMMAFLSLLPAIGSAIVWVPVAAYLLLSGDYTRGLILVFVGVVVIGLVDNLLRPPLVGKETKLPDYVVLISTVGGMTLLGINGFVLGPLIAALFIVAWSLFRHEKETDDAETLRQTLAHQEARTDRSRARGDE
ncbi:AI-2E family transporter [Salinicola rhizosphaerae]|uniref:AI-2E family transporter n=1 Tax=Salinicola rhizosphaerae TaxID=1443141 RepID=A0ABQ3ECD6_9GAMM|nr:AI-2E family transporter [Salinicola rhizosphaerae]GHB33122.1 AI-2E family transporter [Salinicola rhizosphaerae]